MVDANKKLTVNVKVADLPEVSNALKAALRALMLQDQECRYHGTEWVMSVWDSSEPHCESCRKPYFTAQAISKLKGIME